MGNVLAVIEDWAVKRPDKLLYAFFDAGGRELQRLTYRTFLDRVEVIAAHLSHDFRLAQGDRLLLAYPPGLEMICAFFACARTGIIPVPVPAPATKGIAAALFRIRRIIQDCSATGVLATAQMAERVRNAGDAAAGIASLPWITTETLVAGPMPAPRPLLTDILFLQYTSGSTSDPKGVVVSHDNILANARLVLDHEDPVAVSWLPQHHDMGLIGYYVDTALGGGTLYGFSPASFIQRPALWLETISRVRATASSAPNFAFEHCLRPGCIPNSVRHGLDLSSLRFLMAAAEPIKPTVYREFLQAFVPCGLRPESFVVAYGLAENTLAVSSYGRGALSLSKTGLAENRVWLTQAVSGVKNSRHIMSCGQPLGDTQVRIVDPITHCPTPPDGVGEIWIAGSSKCRGYWGNAEATLATFGAEIVGEIEPRERYLRTGDMGFLHEGELYVCGRRKDMLIVRGQNYYPQDIELIVEQASGVRKAGVVAVEVETAEGAEIVVLAEMATRGSDPDPPAISQAIRVRVGLEVDRIVFVAPRSLPKTSSGKLMRFRARQLWQEGTFSIASEFVRGTPANAFAASEMGGGVFEHLRIKYRLKGDEPYSLVEAGLNSLDLVIFLHELSEFLIGRGARELADLVDIGLIQQMSIAELFRLACAFAQSPATAVTEVQRALALLHDQRRSTEMSMMAIDRKLAFEPAQVVRAVELGGPRKILLTGATGFLGPFLLTSLLAQTNAQICCLVRGRDTAHGGSRLRDAMRQTSPRTNDFWQNFQTRVEIVCGDLDQPRLGLNPDIWDRLSHDADTIYHNGALVNYLFSYGRMRAANVLGTNEAVRLACEGPPKTFNYISTTFIFGWATKDVLYETDANDRVELLDFGYSQSKWAAEQVVHDARRRGLTTRIFRPALITPAVNGDGANFDITLRLLAFMVKHGIGVRALNQVSFTPVDITANNVVAISNLPHTANGVYHVTRDKYASMMDVTDIITRLTGRRFEIFDLPAFVPEVIRRCTPDDLLFPLLDFLVGSIDNISEMEFKRYDSTSYQLARAESRWGQADPPLTDVVAGMLRFMQRTGIVQLPGPLSGQEPPRSAAQV